MVILKNFQRGNLIEIGSRQRRGHKFALPLFTMLTRSIQGKGSSSFVQALQIEHNYLVKLEYYRVKSAKVLKFK